MPKLHFTQLVNLNVKILGRRLYSPASEDVAWLEDAQLIFHLIHLSLKCGWVDGSLDGSTLKTNVWKVRIINRVPCNQPASFRLGEYTLPPCMLTF